MCDQNTHSVHGQKMRRSPAFPACIRSGVPHLFLTALLSYATVSLPNHQGETLLDHGKLATSSIPHLRNGNYGGVWRNTVIGLTRWAGATHMAAACRRFAAQPALALELIGMRLEN